MQFYLGFLFFNTDSSISKIKTVTPNGEHQNFHALRQYLYQQALGFSQDYHDHHRHGHHDYENKQNSADLHLDNKQKSVSLIRYSSCFILVEDSHFLFDIKLKFKLNYYNY